jgi:hypothetical protein
MFAREITRGSKLQTWSSRTDEKAHADSAALNQIDAMWKKLKETEKCQNDAYPFEVLTADANKRSYTLVACSKEHRDKWIRCINNSVSKLHSRNTKLDDLFTERQRHRFKDSGGVLQLQPKGQFPGRDPVRTKDMLIVGRQGSDIQYDPESRFENYEELEDLSRHQFAIYSTPTSCPRSTVLGTHVESCHEQEEDHEEIEDSAGICENVKQVRQATFCVHMFDQRDCIVQNWIMDLHSANGTFLKVLVQRFCLSYL